MSNIHLFVKCPWTEVKIWTVQKSTILLKDNNVRRKEPRRKETPWLGQLKDIVAEGTKIICHYTYRYIILKITVDYFLLGCINNCRDFLNGHFVLWSHTNMVSHPRTIILNSVCSLTINFHNAPKELLTYFKDIDV